MKDVSIRKKSMMYIDGQNLFHGCKGFDENLKIDFMKLREKCSEGYDLIRAYYYSGIDPENKSQEGFLTKLSYEGFNVKTRPLVEREGGKIEKGVDIMLTTDLLVHALKDNYDVALIVSGDQDYIQVIEEVKNEGKIVKLICFENTFSNSLKKIADDILVLDNIAKDIEM